MIPALVTVLMLHPVLAEHQPLRLVADGTGALPVAWTVDGLSAGEAPSGAPLVIQAGAGAHNVTAVSEFTGDWQAMARAQPAGAGLAYVPAWTARSTGSPAVISSVREPAAPWPVGALLAVLLLLALSRRLWFRL